MRNLKGYVTGIPRLRCTALARTLLVGLLFCAAISLRAATDAEVNARKNALDVAGAFSNEGFKLRDGHWCGNVSAQEHALIAVNLFAGNQYWFSVGVPEASGKVDVNVYDESGRLVPTQHYEASARAAAGFSPSDSGQYFVSIDLAEGAPTSFCLLYSYK